MNELDQEAIGKILGSTPRAIPPVRFGNFHVVETTQEMLRAREEMHPTPAKPDDWNRESDRTLVQSFEAIRQGAGTDLILWDKEAADQFIRKCRDNGLGGSDTFLKRRLLTIRKHPDTFRPHGIEISPASQQEKIPRTAKMHTLPIEVALVRLRYRHGASIDDILSDTRLAEKLECLVQKVAPELSSQDIRLGALYLRKTRQWDSSLMDELQRLDVGNLDNALEPERTLTEVKLEEVPASPGLIEVRETNRYLYIARNEDLHAAVAQLQGDRIFEMLTTGLWVPQLENTTLQFFAGDQIADVSLEKWVSRLIHDRQPAFNWPIKKAG
jgi:hypothetical protein